MAKTHQEKLFGAACLKLMLERSGGGDPARLELYNGALTDLALTDAEVSKYLQEHRLEVEAALAAHRRGKRSET